MESTYSRIQTQSTPARDIFESTLLGFFGIALVLTISLVTGLTLPLFLVATLVLAIPIIRTPESGLHILILSTITFEHLFSLQPITIGDHEIKLFLFDITLALTGASTLAHARIRSLPFPRFITASILTFASMVVAWGAWSITRQGDSALIVSAVKNMAFYPVIFFIALTLARTQEAWKRVFTTFLVGGVLLIPFILYGVAVGKGVWVDMTPLSTEGTRMLGAPHSFFVLGIMILWMSLAAHRALRATRFALWVAPLFTLWSLGLGVGLFRNLWLGFGVAVISMMIVARDARRRLVGFLARTAGLLAAASALAVISVVVVTNDVQPVMAASRPLLERLSILNPLDIQDSSTEFRAVIFREGMRTFTESPLFGIGFGHAIDVEVGEWAGEQNIRELHNTYAEIAVQMGTVGLVAFGVLLASLARTGRRAYALTPQDMKPAMVGVVIFLITMLTITAFGTYFQTNMYLLFFWTCAALLVAPLSFENEKP